MRTDAFAQQDYDARFNGIPLTEITSNPYDLWFQVPDDGLHLNGGELFGQDILIGDWIEARIVDRDGVVLVPPEYGGDGVVCFPAGTVFKTWVLRRNVPPSFPLDLTTPYAGNPPKNVMVCITYHKMSATVNPKVCVNLDFHKRI